MTLKTFTFKGLSALVVLLTALTLWAQDKPAASTVAKSSAAFDDVANQALAAMKKRAEELNITGVAVVSYSEGDTVQSWSSKMVVVGTIASSPTANSPNGENRLAIAYTKASEMAVTLKESGSHRPLLKGENGWQGGVVAKGKTGLLIAAFSGGVSSDDVKVSRAGLEVLSSSL